MIAGGEKMTEIVVIEWVKFTRKQNTQSNSKTQPIYNDFEELKSNVNNSGGDFGFNSSRFNDERTDDRASKWQNTANDPQASTRERARAIKRIRTENARHSAPTTKG